MTLPLPLAVFVVAQDWMRDIVRRAAPPDFEVQFLDKDDQPAIETLLPRASFVMTGFLPTTWIPLLQQCKLVQLPGVGYDSVNIQASSQARIPLALTPEGTVIGVAEHTVLLILALYKRLAEVHESMRQGVFDSLGWRPKCHFLHSKTLGIVGLGRIGQRVATLARAFDTRLIYYDVFRPDEAVERRLDIQFVPLGDLLSQADIISVHTPLTPESRGLFGAAEFAQMKRDALFINTSRGGTYDMDALYEALRSGHLGGAGLDVFNPEPPPATHPILQLPNVICTPHMATGTFEAHVMKAEAQFDNFQRVLRGEKPINLVS